jgi:LDH2 family malate/lactate/ureidoglycolate dehydrogenase
MMERTSLHDAAGLRDFATSALCAAGLASSMAPTVAEVLVEGDLMGHDTHGLALLPAYLSALENGGMARSGQPEVLRDCPAAMLWDGCFLPGPWLLTEGFRQGVKRAHENGTFTLAIARSHHTASLVAYLRPVVEQGMVAMITVSDPTEACVLPFGGTAPLLSTNPLAWGFPGTEGAILVDVSTSTTTNGMVRRLSEQNRLFRDELLADNAGRASRDPAVRLTDPPGSILPLGGMASGHKGTGLGIVVEALTHGLSGNGRHTGPQGWQANVFLQVFDPEIFGGRSALETELGHLARNIRANKPTDPDKAVRLPGDRALNNRARHLSQGVPLIAPIYQKLEEWAVKLKIDMPVLVS